MDGLRFHGEHGRWCVEREVCRVAALPFFQGSLPLYVEAPVFIGAWTAIGIVWAKREVEKTTRKLHDRVSSTERYLRRK